MSLHCDTLNGMTWSDFLRGFAVALILIGAASMARSMLTAMRIDPAQAPKPGARQAMDRAMNAAFRQFVIGASALCLGMPLFMIGKSL